MKTGSDQPRQATVAPHIYFITHLHLHARRLWSPSLSLLVAPLHDVHPPSARPSPPRRPGPPRPPHAPGRHRHPRAHPPRRGPRPRRRARCRRCPSTPCAAPQRQGHPGASSGEDHTQDEPQTGLLVAAATPLVGDPPTTTSVVCVCVPAPPCRPRPPPRARPRIPPPRRGTATSDIRVADARVDGEDDYEPPYIPPPLAALTHQRLTLRAKQQPNNQTNKERKQYDYGRDDCCGAPRSTERLCSSTVGARA
ncbi:hypothetical protein DFH09DRAFT_1150855 [Mycena vulgaris]|nr:hypothetical protein DFH09DRAFT_1150855 [Mycena vulgaris]